MLLVEHYKCEENKSKTQLSELFVVIKNYTDIIDQKNKTYLSINWFKRLFAFSDRKSILALKKVVQEKQQEVSRLKTEVLKRKQTLLTSYTYQLIHQNDSQRLASLQKDYKAINALYHEVDKVKSVGQTAISRISSAISSVDSASNMEMLDMSTSNKGIEIMSHSANSTASSDIDSAKRAIKDFQEKSNGLKTFFSHHQEFSQIEQFDFISNLFFESTFNDMVFGIMILGQLSSCRASLVKAYDSVEKAVEKIQPHYQEIKKKKEDQRYLLEHFVGAFEVQARTALANEGIDLDQVTMTST